MRTICWRSLSLCCRLLWPQKAAIAGYHTIKWLFKHFVNGTTWLQTAISSQRVLLFSVLELILFSNELFSLHCAAGFLSALSTLLDQYTRLHSVSLPRPTCKDFWGFLPRNVFRLHLTSLSTPSTRVMSCRVAYMSSKQQHLWGLGTQRLRSTHML